jgi:hypothetical protein
MNNTERTEAISVEKALEHATMRAIVRDFSPDKHNMMILAEEVKRLRRVLENEVKCHVEKIDRIKSLEAERNALERQTCSGALSGVQREQDCSQEAGGGAQMTWNDKPGEGRLYHRAYESIGSEKWTPCACKHGFDHVAATDESIVPPAKEPK